jgi:hypothetical protein
MDALEIFLNSTEKYVSGKESSDWMASNLTSLLELFEERTKYFPLELKNAVQKLLSRAKNAFYQAPPCDSTDIKELVVTLRYVVAAYRDTGKLPQDNDLIDFKVIECRPVLGQHQIF